MSVETALIFDSVFLFAEAMQSLKGRQFHPVKLKCSDSNSWKNGLTILNTMNTVSNIHLIRKMLQINSQTLSLILKTLH